MVEEYDALLEKGVTVTDDAMVAELFTEYKVKLVMASYRNIKVTTPEDMITVEAYLGEKH
jgi:2-C-methyl-D-erythritol 4-phosphate cytidylyltransferase